MYLEQLYINSTDTISVLWFHRIHTLGDPRATAFDNVLQKQILVQIGQLFRLCKCKNVFSFRRLICPDPLTKGSALDPGTGSVSLYGHHVAPIL